MADKKFRDRAAELCSRLSLNDKISLICTIQQAIPTIGLDKFNVGAEVARGFVGRSKEHYSTVFPQPIGLAGTFNTSLMAELGEIAGNEARAYYNSDHTISPCLWGPTVDMERNPLWGRTEEGYGEDVCLAGNMTTAYTKAMAADNGKFVKTIPTLKHFAANNNEKDRDKCNSDIPLRLRFEYYYAAFMYAVKYGGAKSVMTSYNEINGIPALCNPDLEKILKKEWGLWFAVTDGCDFSQTVTAHRYCENHAEVLAEALKAGCDVINDAVSLIRNAVEKALDKGLLSMEELDRTVCNILYARLKLGNLSAECPYNNITLDVLEDKKSAEVNLRAAREQMVLLKNNGILPLKKDTGKIAVLGAVSDENFRDWYTGYFRKPVSVVEGIRQEFPESEVFCDDLWDIVAIKSSDGKFLSVHEDGTIYADSETADESTLFKLHKWGEGWYNLFSVKYGKYAAYKDGTLKLSNDYIYDWFTAESMNFRKINDRSYLIEDYLLHRRIICDEKGKLSFKGNIPVIPENTFTIDIISSGIDRGKDLAEKCDAVIFCAGNDPVQCTKECYDRTSLSMGQQEDYALEIHAVNPDTVLAVISSFPYAVTRSDEKLPAIVYSTHAGANLGTALAETISGKNVPAGRLAMTWYRSELDLPDIMEYDIEKSGTTYMYFRGNPLYPFGYGLSYAEFEYRNLKISANENGSLTALVSVENISDIDSDEVVQLYFTVENSAVKRPIKKLCAFERIYIKAHSKSTVRLEIIPDILQIYDVRREKFITESGMYKFMAGGSSDKLTVSAELAISGESLGKRSDSFNAYTFDKGYDVKTGWSKRLKRHYIRVDGWSGTAVYGGIDFTGKSCIKIKVSSVFDDRPLILNIGKNKYVCDVKAATAYDDFKEYAIPITADNSNVLTLTLSGGMSLLDISVT